MMIRCPGQDTGFWDLTAIYEVTCPKCNKTVEFFKDDPVRTCKHCGHEFVNPKMDFGCAAYCKYADQCLGELSPDLLAQREDLFKDRVAIEMKRYFSKDFKEISHAMLVGRYAGEIIKEERANPPVVLSAAYLQNIGAREAGRKFGRVEPHHLETEGPDAARGILSKLGAMEELVDEVCDILGRQYHPKNDDSLSFRIVHDAALLVDLEEKRKAEPFAQETLERVIGEHFLTETGKKLARKNLLK